MASTQKGAVAKVDPHTLTLGEFAQQVITDQFKRVVKRKKGVLADKETEHLHQMRVGTRRLRTALQIFENAVCLPKSANAKQLRDLARVLGEVRDLDVQTASLQDDYLPGLNQREQKKLEQVLKVLINRRKIAFARMKAVLNGEFERIHKSYVDWIETPKFTDVAQLPIGLVLPDVLSPLLSELCLHPGWLIPTDQISEENAEVLHDLRKLCKHVRYQTEFFVPFYGDEFYNWVQDIKQIQDNLGTFQDTQILQALLAEELGRKSTLPELQAKIRQQQAEALANWEDTRQTYLDEGFRYHLHELLLQPTSRSTRVHPELLKSNAADSN
ncbi:CHAD domain-containing protein [Thermocoleostomius sinensis]|uniref:CHAD domain-containing protein n=1 Tax=Thermocoleostomius sinensis A174 TaxID=2016057 RepID=A0A9E9C3W6_9CYAN|nr:CHAD domain-containing protein [Thermocoleostomius sinensis]WAL59371.1 CHAD domain-containing protein [Thermocoleostomius sinensis A174]